VNDISVRHFIAALETGLAVTGKSPGGSGWVENGGLEGPCGQAASEIPQSFQLRLFGPSGSLIH
jgi:hypothetical protein